MTYSDRIEHDDVGKAQEYLRIAAKRRDPFALHTLGYEAERLTRRIGAAPTSGRAANTEQNRNFLLDDESPMSDIRGAGRHPGRVVFDIVHRKE
jgi:hypothetical protein